MKPIAQDQVRIRRGIAFRKVSIYLEEPGLKLLGKFHRTFFRGKNYFKVHPEEVLELIARLALLNFNMNFWAAAPLPALPPRRQRGPGDLAGLMAGWSLAPLSQHTLLATPKGLCLISRHSAKRGDSRTPALFPGHLSWRW